MSRSLWFGSLSILLLASLLFLFVSCFEQPVSPYQPVNTKLYLSVQSSTLQFTIGQYYVDTVGDSINIGVTRNLPQFVDSVTVGIFSDAYLVEQGTILKNINASDKDPTWFKTLLNKDGKKYIIAKAFIQDGYKSFDTIIVNVLPRQTATTPRSKPHITVNGLTTIAAGQVCSLSVTVNDSTVGQTHTFFAKQDTQSQWSVFTPPFKWTPLTGFSGTSTVYFKVADSDSPSYLDTQTVVITVLAVSPINHAPKWANKTINEVGSPGNTINLTVSKMCTDPDGDLLTFSLVSGISPSTGTITTSGDSSIYSFTPGPGDTGTFYPRVIAVDPLGLSDTMTISLKINAVVVKSYSVTYDGNGSTGGSIPSDPSTYTSGSTVTIKTNSGLLVKTGSTFAGWNTVADGTGTSYAASATFAIGSANITLYAMWIVNPVISAATAGNGQVTLTWAAVTGATSYNIYYAAGTTVDKTGTKVTGATSPAIVASLTNGTQYAFAVSAITASGESALSVVATATPQIPAAGIPTISSTMAGSAQVTVTWAAVTGATSYNIYYTAGTTVDKTGTKVTGPTSPAIVAALTNGTQYAFAVSAVNASGESALSTVATATPQVAAAGVPTISAANAGNAQVTVTWAAVTGATSYNIYYAAGTTVDKTGTKVTGATSPAVVATLTNGTQYAFAVSAVNAGGESGLSTIATATPQVPAPGAATISSANAGNAQVTVTWAAVTGATSYNIYYAAGTTVDKTGTKVTGATSPAVVASLTNGTQYAFAVSAVNAGGESALSTVATATPQVPAAGAPTISSANAGNALVTVTWAAVTGATSYNIYYAAGTTVDKTGTKVTGSTSPAVVASLTNGTQYAFAVSAVNAGGESALSAVATATPQVPAAGAPTISSANAGNALVTVTWAAVPGAISYNLYYAKGTTVDKTGTKVSGATSPAVVAALTNGTQYAFAVSAINAGGESALSTVATATPIVLFVTFNKNDLS
jgi:fibronectin type 3 domain-containing protein